MSIPCQILLLNKNIKHVPIQLPQIIWQDDKLQPLVVEVGAVVVPAEDGSEIVPLEEFDVGMVNGQVVLVAEVNPIILLAGVVFGGLVGIGTGAVVVAGLKSVGVVVGASAA